MRLRVAPAENSWMHSWKNRAAMKCSTRQALAMLKKVPALPEPPEALRDREFAILVPVVFRMQR